MRRLLAQLVGFALLMQVLDRLSLPVVVTATSVLLAVGCLVFLASSPGSRPDS